VTTLERVIGVRALTLNAINIMVGASIFAVPAIVAEELGAAGWIAFLLCGAMMGLVMFCFAAAASRVTADGGLYAYADRAFGPFAGSLVGVMLWLPNGAIATSAVCNLFVDTLGQVWLTAGTGGGRVVAILLVYAVFATINVLGVKPGVRVSEVLTAVKVTPLILIAVIGVFAVSAANLRWTGALSFSALAQMIVLLNFTFQGTEGALSASGEVRDAARAVPLSILLSLGTVTLLYIALQVVAQGVLGAELSQHKAAPLAETAGAIVGQWGRRAIVFTALLSSLGYFAADTLSTPRAIYAQARSGLLPSGLAAVHPRWRTPYVAIIAYVVLSATLALSGSFRSLAILTAAGSLTMYLIVCAAAAVLDRRDVRADRAPLRLPGGPTIPVLSCAIIAALLSTLGRRELVATAVMVALASLPYWFQRIRSRSPA
jgi:basic amino acid/polyamine antiporter, APA family